MYKKNITSRKGKLLAALSPVSKGQVQQIVTTTDGVEIICWFGEPGDSDTMMEAIVTSPWNIKLSHGNLLPLVLVRFPDDRGRADMLDHQGKKSINVKVRYTDQTYDKIIKDTDMIVLSARTITVTVPDLPDPLLLQKKLT